MRQDDMSDMAEIAPPPKSKAVPALLVINALLITGVLFWSLNKKSGNSGNLSAGSGDSQEPSARSGGKLVGPTLKLDSFVIQLKAVDVERYAHVTVELEVNAEEDKGRILNSLPVIRDAVISYLVDQTADDLRGSEGMARLKQEILTRLQRILPRVVNNIYITDFILQ